MDTLLTSLAALVPSIGVGALFYFVMRAIVRADRNERQAQARIEADERLAAKTE